jgi:hypothetical protein
MTVDVGPCVDSRAEYRLAFSEGERPTNLLLVDVLDGKASVAFE